MCGTQCWWQRRRRAARLEAIYVEQSAPSPSTIQLHDRCIAFVRVLAITSHWSNIRSPGSIAAAAAAVDCSCAACACLYHFALGPLCLLHVISIKRRTKRRMPSRRLQLICIGNHQVAPVQRNQLIRLSIVTSLSVRQLICNARITSAAGVGVETIAPMRSTIHNQH